MKEFGAFVKKEFFHIFRDLRTLLVIVGMPVILIILFGFALSMEVRNVNVAIFAKQENPMINELAHKIDCNGYFTFVQTVKSEREVDSLMRVNAVDAVIMLDGDFSSELLRASGAKMSLVVDASNPVIAPSQSMYLLSALNDFLTEELGGADMEQAGIGANVRMLYNPQLKSSYNFVPGVMGLVLILICALMTSVSIVREKETGTMEVLLVSPVRNYTILFAKMLPYFVVSCAVLIIVLVLSYTVLEVPLSGGLVLVLVLSMIYIVLALSLGLLVSTITDTQVAATLISGVVFIVPFMMLSDFAFPIENLPVYFRWIAELIPAKWYIGALRKVMIEGVGLAYVWKDILVMLGMTALLLGVSLKKSNDRLD